LSYPRFYAAIKEMAREEALHTKTARAIARRAGLRSLRTGSDLGPGTLVDATLGPTHIPFQWQWTVDLSGYERIRLDIRHHDNVLLYYSVDGPSTSALDPGDYEAFTGVFVESGLSGILQANDGSALRWMVIPEELRVPLRLCFAHDSGNPGTPSVSMDTDLGGPWGAMLQAE